MRMESQAVFITQWLVLWFVGNEGIIQMSSREHRRVGRVFCAEGVWSASGCIEKETFRDQNIDLNN